MNAVNDDSQWINGTVLAATSEQHPVILDPLTKLNFRMLIGDILKSVPSALSTGLFLFGTRWVSYVDICGVVRQVTARENYYVAHVDDGTGQIICTIWRKHVNPKLPDLVSHNHHPSDVVALGQKLLNLSSRYSTIVYPVPGSGCSRFEVGDTVHLRGRLQFFREATTVSASYCRIMTQPREIVESVLQAHKLKTLVYSRPYNPVEVVERLKIGLQNCTDRDLLNRIRAVIEEDALFVFTELDLKLHMEVVRHICAESDHLTDALYCCPDWEHISEHGEFGGSSATTRALNRRVQNIIEQFLKDGTIFRSSDPIGGNQAYIYTLKHMRLMKQICRIVSKEQAGHDGGVPFQLIFEKLRTHCHPSKSQRPFRSIGRPALARAINYLLEQSRIYIVNPDCYKVA